MTTSALLDFHGIDGDRRFDLESRQRRQSMPIGQGLQGVTLRDQKPMPASALAKCLDDGLAPQDWYRLLNGRCFFWLSEKRLQGMLGTYRDRPHIVLTVDTESLVRKHAARIELSRINSGYALRVPARRGKKTFQAIDAYVHSTVVELCVIGGVPDIRRHLIAVERRHGAHILETLWRRSSSPRV